MIQFHPSFAARVRDLCFLGATNAEIATLLGVSVNTLDKWREEYPEFGYAWKIGRDEANAKVAAALFKRCIGYEHSKKKEKLAPDGALLETNVETVHLAPDVGACIFWLTNRRPDLWQQRVEQVAPKGANIPLDTLSEIEAARYIAFAMAKAGQALIESQNRSNENGSVRTIEPET